MKSLLFRILGGVACMLVIAPAVRSATYYIGHAGYGGPEAGNPNFRNYDAGAFNLETFLSTEIAAGERSLAVRLELLDEAATLTDERIDAEVARVVETLRSRLGARLRA